MIAPFAPCRVLFASAGPTTRKYLHRNTRERVRYFFSAADRPFIELGDGLITCGGDPRKLQGDPIDQEFVATPAVQPAFVEECVYKFMTNRSVDHVLDVFARGFVDRHGNDYDFFGVQLGVAQVTGAFDGAWRIDDQLIGCPKYVNGRMNCFAFAFFWH